MFLDILTFPIMGVSLYLWCFLSKDWLSSISAPQVRLHCWRSMKVGLPEQITQKWIDRDRLKPNRQVSMSKIALK